MFEFHPSPVFWDSQPFFWSLFILLGLSQQRLFVPPPPLPHPDVSFGNNNCTHTRAPAVPFNAARPHTCKHLQGWTLRRGSQASPLLPRGIIFTLSALRDPGNLPLLPPLLSPTLLFHFPQYFTFQERKKKKPPLRRHDCSVSCSPPSDSFTHKLWHQQSAPLLHSLLLCMPFFFFFFLPAHSAEQRERSAPQDRDN